MLQNTGFGLSALLIAAGAILKWAVTYEAEGIDLNQVGLIIFIVGLGLGLISLVMAASGSRRTVDSERESLIDGRPVVERQRDVITDHDRG